MKHEANSNTAASENHKCNQNVKRETKTNADDGDEDDDETVIIVRKRGNKVFIEL
jgi:hypothetical protein